MSSGRPVSKDLMQQLGMQAYPSWHKIPTNKAPGIKVKRKQKEKLYHKKLSSCYIL